MFLGNWPVEEDSRGQRLLSVGFGETGCEVILTDCHVDTCYTMFDLTAQIDVDVTTAVRC